MVYYRYGPVAQWIEQLRPKEKVMRSTRVRATKRTARCIFVYVIISTYDSRIRGAKKGGRSNFSVQAPYFDVGAWIFILHFLGGDWNYSKFNLA